MHFVIVGSINCSQFTYAVMVAQRLKESLPDFSYLKLAMKPEEYKRWLVSACQENHWYHTQSPVIWREIGLKMGRKEFIGDINKFLDLCYDYYGIPQDILSAEQFNREEIKWFTKRTESEYFDRVTADAKERRQYRSRQVCITGASSQITEIIVMELLALEIQRRENGLVCESRLIIFGSFVTQFPTTQDALPAFRSLLTREIRLFDEPTKEKKLSGISLDAKYCPAPSGLGNCRVANTLKEALFNVDLVIVLDAFPRKANETLVKWLKRNRNAMCALGKALNKYAPAHCRVILGGPSTQPLCYNATVLASFATKLHVRNIVAVTQDLGRQMLKFLSQKADVPLKDFYCPPVWGFVGLNKFVDLRKTLITYLYKVPGKRMNSTIPQGTEKYELRTCETLIDDETEGQLHTIVAGQRAEIFPQLGRWPCLAKATAILDLLRLWGIKQEDGNGEILCLGVYSDGTFNIPRGIYWSQPVVLIKGFWTPFPDYPIPRSPYFNFYYLFMFSVASLYRTKVRPRIYVPPKKKLRQKERQKFDFDKVAEEVGMPVIRTDVECVTYLKYLTKTELGIDLDAVKDCIEEEEIEEVKTEVVPPEEEVEKPIYCECWRQELKELQKVVFEHSSTTEVEVDLSENVSGSEWSVINAPSKPDAPASVEVPKWQKDEKKVVSRFPEDLESLSTECSCGLLPTGSICKCLGSRGSRKEKESSEGEKVSTEHFYKEQNAEIFEDDLKDVLYEDTFLADKHPGFGSNVKAEDGPGSGVKFYGKEDAVQDLKAKLKMQKRILRYEQIGEVSSEEDEKSTPGEETTTSEKYSEKSSDKKSYEEYVVEEGGEAEVCYGEIGVLELASSEQKESSVALEGEQSVSVHTFPNESEKSYLMSEENLAGSGSEKGRGEDYSLSGSVAGSVKPVLSEISGEKTLEQSSVKSTEDLAGMWGEEEYSYEEIEKKSVEEVLQAPKKKKKKREGIPLCCLCRCLIPEGLSVCPCGESTVVEVFKKESVEVFIQNEDDVEYMIEYLEKKSSYDGAEKPIKITPSDEFLEPLRRGRTGDDGDDDGYGYGGRGGHGGGYDGDYSGDYDSADYYDDDESLLRRKGRRGRGLGDDYTGDYGPTTKRRKRKLPPDSFFPFHPKLENRFKESIRPFELTKEFIESYEKKEIEIPPRCLEQTTLPRGMSRRRILRAPTHPERSPWGFGGSRLRAGVPSTTYPLPLPRVRGTRKRHSSQLFNLAKRELEERSMPGEDADEFDYEYSETEEQSVPSVCEEVEKIRTDFSDLKMFVPCGLEDWRVTVQKKYQEWYFQGPKIKDETYYDIAIEQLSDEEYEDDEELEKYFES